MPHIHELIDHTATVYIVHQNKVLLRMHEKYGFWVGVGGHIELDEDANHAAVRECQEEVGLDVTLIPPPHAVENPIDNDYVDGYRELIPPWYLNIHHTSPTHRHHDLIFFATSETDRVTPENDTDKWLWLTAEQVEANETIHLRIKNYALAALSALTK